MPHEPLWVAVAIAPDARHGAGLMRKRVVGGHPPVVRDAVDLAVGTRDVLCILALPSLADREKQVAFAVEHEAGAEVDTALSIEGRVGLEDLLLIDERAILQVPTHDRRHG